MKVGPFKKLVLKRAEANMNFYAETGKKPFTRLNIWLNVWFPVIISVILYFVYKHRGDIDELFLPIIITFVVFWAINTAVVISRCSSTGKAGKVIGYNIICSILYFVGFFMAPFVSLILLLLSIAFVDLDTAGPIGTIRNNYIIYRMIRYEGIAPVNANTQQ